MNLKNAFGMAMPGRTYATNIDGYKYGHNGQERDFEIFEGALSAEFWEYDSRTGRRWENDPIIYEGESPYACFSNNPILLNDPLGLADESKKDKNPKKDKNGETKKERGERKRDEANARKGKEQYRYNERTDRLEHINGASDNGGKNRIAGFFGKVGGLVRKVFTGAKRALSLIPQGKWVTGSMVINGTVAPGSFNQVDFRKAIANMGPFMEKVTGISGGMWNGDAYIDMSGKWHEDGNIGGYARVVGMRNGINGRGWHGLHLNTGFRGFIQNRSDKHMGAVDVGAELIPGINFAEEFLNSGISMLKGNLGKFAGTYGGPLMIFELINKQVMYPGYSGTTSLRVVNSSITKHMVEYAMVIRYRYWVPVKFKDRSWLWKLFHKRVKKA